MTPQEFCAAVYCAILEVAAFDPVRGELALKGAVTDHGSPSPIQLDAAEVTDFVWRGTVKDPKGFFELSTVEIRPHAPGWVVTFEPWYTSHLQFTCARLVLNGKSIEGRGAWYQDSLEGPSSISEQV